MCLFIICKIRGEKQISTWNHSIGGYGTHGNGSQHCLKSRRKTENKVSFHINPFTYGNFAEKRDLKLVEGFWTLWCYKLTTKPFLQVVHFVAFLSRCHILASKVRACAECKISRLSLFRPSFAFLASSFVSSFVGQLVGYISLASVF